MEPVLLYDTTLRDGTQGENINFSAEEKIKIAQRLDDIGIHYIEGGWPGSNPRDRQFFDLAKHVRFKNARLAAFGSTRRPGILPGDDPNLTALVESETPAVAIFGKTWDHHVKLMSNTLEENLSMIEDTVAWLKRKGREVIYDAEHFFDGYRDNPDYAMLTLHAAIRGGADLLVLCDTNGGSLPSFVSEAFRTVKTAVEDAGVRLGIHTHNDSGLAVANSIEAVNQGAVMVQGTINGYGERCGNADLITLIPILAIKMGRPCMSLDNLKKLRGLSRFVSETANIVPLNSRPFVGKSAFAHKGGIHVSAVMKDPGAYEHIDPGLVGNTRNVSDLRSFGKEQYRVQGQGNGHGHRGQRI